MNKEAKAYKNRQGELIYYKDEVARNKIGDTYTKTEVDKLVADAGKVKSVNSQTGDVIIAIPDTLPASDVHAWAKAENKPNYTASEVGAIPAANANNYLDKTSTANNVVAGRMQVGNFTSNNNINNAFLHVRRTSGSITGKETNGACFAINSDGTASFSHKTYNDNGGNPRNMAVFRFSNKGMQFGINTGDGSDLTEDMRHDVFYDGYESSKLTTESKDIIGAINELVERLSSFHSSEGVIFGE